VDKERGLDPISLVDEDQVVVRPQREKDTGQVSICKIVFCSVLVDDDAFQDQGASNLVVHLTPVIRTSIGLGNPGEARKKPLCNGADRVGGGLLFVELRFARGNIEPQEVLHG